MAEGPHDYEGYDDLVRLGRSLTPGDRQLLTPPPDLWARINAEVDDEPAGRVVSTTDRRARRRRAIVAVAAVAAAACVVVGVAIARESDGVRTIDDVALSNADLDPAGAATTGRARLVVLDDGTQAIDLDVHDLPSIDGGFFELWLIDRDIRGMVSMGPVRGNGRYLVPSGVDPASFPVIDLSIEPADGVPTHSGQSVLRGTLA